MNCRNCGTFLAEGVHICPQCGTSTTHSPYDSGSDDPTAPASYKPSQIPPIQYSMPSITPPPPSQYSSEPSEAPHISSYPTQHPPDGRKKVPNTALMVGMALLLVVLIGGGLMLFSHQQSGGQTIYKATVTARATTVPTATPDLTKNPYPPGTGTLMINDPMRDNSKGYEWLEVTTSPGSCGFNNEAYHDTRPQGGSQVCRADALYLSTLSNIAYEAQLTITQGDSCGLAFRINSLKKTGYIFVIGLAGDYTIDTYNFEAQNGNYYTVLSKGYSSAIKSGLNQANLVAVVANSSTISAYINNQLVDQIQDSTYKQGKIGIYGSGQATTDIEAKDVRLWSF